MGKLSQLLGTNFILQKSVPCESLVFVKVCHLSRDGTNVLETNKMSIIGEGVCHESLKYCGFYVVGENP